MSLPADYFDEMYDADPDPWGFGDRWYEERKRALTLALLPEPRYDVVFEPGCSIGILTEQLASRCTSLLAIDVSAAAVEATRLRCAHQPHVKVVQGSIVEAWPLLPPDLAVLSEVVYYLSEEDLGSVLDKAFKASTVLAVHWRHPVEDYPMTGDAAHDALATGAVEHGLTCLAQHVEDDFIAAVWSRDSRSVAARTGLR